MQIEKNVKIALTNSQTLKKALTNSVFCILLYTVCSNRSSNS